MEKITKIKKVEKSFERLYRPIVIWSDDLADIIDTMKQHADTIEIRTADYRYDSLDDLRQHVGGHTQFELSITASSFPSGGPSVSLELNRTMVKLWIFDPKGGPEAAQMFYEINEVIQRCQRRLAPLYSLALMFTILPLFILAQFALSQYNKLPAAAVLAVIGAFASLWFLWACYVVMYRHAVIKLQRRSEVRPFFDRNKDQLALLIIGALMGGAVTLGGVVAKEQLYPSICAQKQQ